MDAWFKMVDILPMTNDPVFVGEEMVNGVMTNHFTFNVTGLGAESGAEVVASNGEYWLAQDGQYVVKYSVIMETRNGPAGDPNTQTMHSEFYIEVTDINQPIVITMPPHLSVSLAAFADRIASHRGLRSLFFLTAALLSILLIGYHFGTFDQIVHIPFLKATADPSLYPGDAFVALRDPPISYFWNFFIPFYRWGILEAAMFAAHVLATTLTFAAVWRLSLTLFGDAVASTLAVITFIFPHFGFLGFPVIEFSLLNRTFVLPFLLFAIDLYLHKRYGWAFLLLGLTANLHPLSAGMVTAMLLFPTLVEVRRIGFARLFQAAATFLIGAAPILLLWVNNNQPVDWSLRPEWLSIIARGVLTQVLYPFAAIPFVLLLTLSGFSAVGLLLIARRTAPAPAVERPVSLMLIAAGLIFAVGVFTAQFLPITVLIEMQLNRVSLFIFIFAYLYFANYLAREYRAQSMHSSSFALLAGTFISNPLAIFPLAIWGLLRWL